MPRVCSVIMHAHCQSCSTCPVHRHYNDSLARFAIVPHFHHHLGTDVDCRSAGVTKPRLACFLDFFHFHRRLIKHLQITQLYLLDSWPLPALSDTDIVASYTLYKNTALNNILCSNFSSEMKMGPNRKAWGPQKIFRCFALEFVPSLAVCFLRLWAGLNEAYLENSTLNCSINHRDKRPNFLVRSQTATFV